MMTDLNEAQRDMRRGYLSGGAGVLASSLAYFAAAAAVEIASPQKAIWVLFAGGVLIHPVSILICKLLGAPGGASKGNPLVRLAAASTFWLIFSLPLAYAAGLVRIEYFFPAMLLVIGGRYMVFASLFGMPIYWALGAVLAGAGFLLGRSLAAPLHGALAGGAIEATFALAILALHGRWARTIMEK